MKKRKELEVKNTSKLKNLHKIVGGNGHCLECGFNGSIEVRGFETQH